MREVREFLQRYRSRPRALARAFVSHPLRVAAGAGLCAAVAVAATVHFATRPPKASRELAAAKTLLQVGRSQEALLRLQAAENADGNTGEIHYWQGRVKVERGEMAAAANDFEAAVKHDPQGRYLAAWAFTLYHLGYMDSSIKKSQAAMAAGYENPAIYNNLGHAYRQRISAQQNHFDDAKQWFDMAVAADPAMAQPRIGRALIAIQRYCGGQTTAVDAAVVADIRVATSGTAANAKLHFVAAEILNIAAKDDASLVNEGLDHLEAALEHGLSPAAVRQKYATAFSSYKDHPRFAALANRREPAGKRAPAPLELLVFPQ